ncbi:YbaB/EbfC family nucleoid-associated protein [Amycolatopsis thermoflava]|uniref:DNA-binding protein YbaB n=1 Tax=Amycolatopsis thermoflava TaxID=84480 RepID=A0A3N2GSJ0_9PSEU|nr:YbaB/EbfC family nucleoid-associated protein [Amycolatopsis thermoflava]ROS39584.1 DNA-binding protein YbaB [Amycolatopsis thermoflava]
MQPNLRPGEDFQHLLEQQVREMQQKAAALQDALGEASATVRSKDGSVTVTIAPNGALQRLELGHRACDLGPARLTAAIMEAVREGQRQAARAVSDSFTAIAGDGESAEVIKSFLPPVEDEPEDFAEPEAEATPPPPPPVPPVSPVQQQRPAPRRPRPASPADDDDEMRPW